jgi:3',5'-cyclic AMP phosphodiesterase CpdA
MLIAQLTDLHIKAERRKAYGIVDTAGFLEAAIAQLLQHNPRPDAVVITGDLVDYGTREEYELLRQLLTPLQSGAWTQTPLYLIAGNHDHPGVMRECFPEHTYLRQVSQHLSYAVDLGILRLVALDSNLLGESGGRVDAERLAWLDETLSQSSSKPTVVLMHHPPFKTGIAHMDAIGLEGADALAQVLLKHPQVERVLCGHLHRSIQARFGGTLASTCPSTAHQVALDLNPGGLDCFVLEPPGYQLHWWNGAQLVTHTAVVGAFAGPYRFREGGVLID